MHVIYILDTEKEKRKKQMKRDNICIQNLKQKQQI